MIKVILTFLFVSFGITYTTEADATNIYCKTKQALESLEDSLVEACESGDLVNTETPDPDAEEGDDGYLGWFFTIPEDMECDLGLSLTSFDLDFDFSLDSLNLCNVLQTVTESAVDEINEEFDELESEIDDATDSLEDDVDIDLDEVFEDGWDDVTDDD